MAYSGSMKIPKELGIQSSHGFCNPHANVMVKSHLHTVGINFSSRALRQDCWSLHVLSRVHKPTSPAFCRCNLFLCQSVLTPVGNEAPIVKSATVILTRSYDVLQASFKSSLLLKLIPAVGTMAFAAWGLGPLMRFGRTFFLRSSDSGWKKSNTNDITTSYIQPLLLWAGATLLCRALDQIALPSVAGEVVKQRVLTFVRSLSTVLAFAYCLSSLIQQAQKFVTETNEPNDARNMGFGFAAKAVYTAVWVAGASLFMELLGFSTQRWLTAGGLGTVLLTLAGREIFTNFLSSLMIHATRPFVVGEWIQTKIQGYEVSGTVEHVGWWSPTVIRADDREAVHIPNHKFTVNIVRNLSQKTHWRIKTHLAISHMDVSKINNIVADMRKVLAKNPQVEQQKLHRRVFLENINPENQALMILVSCFVKTSHIEEYLCVKEEILLDLHRVISHHRARLATPIRTVRKVYGEADLENIPFSGANVGHAGTGFSRPFLLIEPSSKIRAEDKSKASTRPVSRNVEEKAYSITVDKVDTDATSASDLGSKSDDMMKAPVILNSGATSEISTTSDPKIQNSSSDGSVPYVTEIQDQPEKKNSGNAWTEKMAPNPELKSPGNVTNNTHISISSKSGTENINISSAVSPMKQDNEKAVTSSSVSSSSLEDNIVLGVALEGSKRTLPIEDEVDAPPPPTESNDSTGKRNGSESAIVGSNKEDVHRG